MAKLSKTSLVLAFSLATAPHVLAEDAPKPISYNITQEVFNNLGDTEHLCNAVNKDSSSDPADLTKFCDDVHVLVVQKASEDRVCGIIEKSRIRIAFHNFINNNISASEWSSAIAGTEKNTKECESASLNEITAELKAMEKPALFKFGGTLTFIPNTQTP